MQLWPFRLLLPLLLYLGIAFAVPGLRRSVAWAKLGRFDPRLLALVLGTILVSLVALAGWVVLAAPDLNRYTQSLPEVPGWVIPFVGLGFALLNAAMEEVSFRGVVMEGFENALGPGKAALILQALLFGFLHYRAGFPNGVWGVAMTFVFGLMLAALRRRSGGLLVPWVAHVGADAVIFALVVRFVLAGA
jgi:membrane protease YdiL (CAAX protease family)